MSIFQKITTQLAAWANDATILNVNTFTGSLSAEINAADGNIDDWIALLDSAKNNGNVQLVAATKVYIDGDQDNFYATDISPKLHEIHNEAVDAGLEVRHGFVRLAKELF